MSTGLKSMIVQAKGVHLHLIEWRPTGLPYVLLHGLGDNARVWDEFASGLVNSARPIAFDLPGHGDSCWTSDQAYSASRMASHLLVAIDQLRLGDLVIIGHSLGAEVAMHLVERRPQAARALILVDWAPERRAEAATHVHRQLLDTATQQFSSVHDYVEFMAAQRPLLTREALLRIARHGLRQRSDGSFETKHDPALHKMLPDGVARGPLMSSERKDAVENILRRIDRPTLVVRGEGSSVLSASSANRIAKQLLSRGRLAVIPKAGHGPMLENPARFSAEVRQFLQDVLGTAETLCELAGCEG